MTHPLYLSPDKREAVVTAWKKYGNVRVVAKRTKVACSTIYGILEKAQLAPRDRGPKLGADMEARLHELFAAQDRSDREIARLIGWDRRRVRYHRERLQYKAVYRAGGGRAEDNQEVEHEDADVVQARRHARLGAAEQRWGEALGGRQFGSLRVSAEPRMSCVPFPHLAIRSSADW